MAQELDWGDRRKRIDAGQRGRQRTVCCNPVLGTLRVFTRHSLTQCSVDSVVSASVVRPVGGGSVAVSQPMVSANDHFSTAEQRTNNAQRTTTPTNDERQSKIAAGGWLAGWLLWVADVATWRDRHTHID